MSGFVVVAAAAVEVVFNYNYLIKCGVLMTIVVENISSWSYIFFFVFEEFVLAIFSVVVCSEKFMDVDPMSIDIL